ncbi:uncharacterized protein G2W53_007835 [Senna tora]|uniref:Uncharacterized protein n=1 Tax=Senna tora TaxID=362788 RepID=A0A834X8P3_9FABA|nr:uncharacterized protein G2W53_007835 [Senna tora]
MLVVLSKTSLLQVELLLQFSNIPQYDFNLKFFDCNHILNTSSSAAAEAFLLHSRSTSAFSTARSSATRRRRREIYPVAMDPASMVRVFAADESVERLRERGEKRPINLLGFEIITAAGRARDFRHLAPNQTLPLRGGGGFFSFSLPKHFCVFSGKICCNETTDERSVRCHGSSFDGESFCRDESV